MSGDELFWANGSLCQIPLYLYVSEDGLCNAALMTKPDSRGLTGTQADFSLTLRVLQGLVLTRLLTHGAGALGNIACPVDEGKEIGQIT